MTSGANYAGLITLINTGLAFITVVTSIVNLHLEKKQMKQEREQNRQKAEEQQKRYLEEKRHIEEVDRLHEKPYLVFQEARISDESDEKITRIDFIFKNKGRGAAYDIVPELECMAKTVEGKTKVYRCDPVQDPIAMVGEQFTTMWTLGCEQKLVDFIFTMPIEYQDASGRKYRQKYDLIFLSSGDACIKNYAQPELVDVNESVN
mgnify:FL=1